MQAIDRPALEIPVADYEEMLAEANVSKTKKLPGILPVYVGMDMILTESILPPHLTPGTEVMVIGIEPHPSEPPITDRPSLLEHGCVLLRFMPLAIYVKAKTFAENIWGAEGSAASERGDDLTGVVAVVPTTRGWRFVSDNYAKPLHVRRTQAPLLPARQGTLHGIQGTIADPGLVAFWRFPPQLSKESLWLAHYVILSRPRRLASLVSHGLPKREILEQGPPESISEAFQRLFGDKIQATKAATETARRKLEWPPRPQT